MASWRRVLVFFRKVPWSSQPPRRIPPQLRAAGAGLLASALAAGSVAYYRQRAAGGALPLTVYADEQKGGSAPPLSARRLRFNQFASVEYQQEPYMTPRDFLFSVMLEKVDRKLQKRILSTKDVEQMLVWTSRAKPGTELFRTLGDNGLVSYTEYLFLLTILTKPHTGFHIAFKMLDVDGNEHVDKKEFLKLKKIMGKSKARPPKEDVQTPAEEAQGVTTTLQAHFFGRSGDNKLQYRDFCRFMEDLQAEVQQMEFLQFSRGMDTMRREDFAAWLLHYTNEEDNQLYWDNMRSKIPAGQSITFEEFKAFCLFTNNLDDFGFSVKLVADSRRPIGMAQFKRAVKIATGHDLSDNVLDTIFKLFDMDGDNCLSHKEFIGVMEDRVLRGLKVSQQSGVSGYWKCVKRETLKAAKEALGGAGCPI